MSHYSVLVIGENVDEQLAPFHEFECTGLNDQYVQEIDKTEEVRKEYESHTETRYKDPDGNLHDPFTAEGNWDPRFWRELTPEEDAKYGKILSASEMEDGTKLYSGEWHDGGKYRTKAFVWPSEGWSEVKVPTRDVETLAQFIEGWNGHKTIKVGDMPDLEDEHKYGYCVVDENGEVIKDVDRTNPERKWDWYSVGGRWIGFFKLKAEVAGKLDRRIGLGTQSLLDKDDPPGIDRADQCMKQDIDVEGMRSEAATKAAEEYDLFLTVTSESFIDPDPPHRRIQLEGDPAGFKPRMPRHLSWEQVQAKHRTGEDVDYDASRKEYQGQLAVKALRAHKDTIWFEPDNFLCTREEYIERARRKAITTFAVVKDGKWYERGGMGWFGVVHGEKDYDAWLKEFSELVDSLPDETLLTVVDCHI
jgi:hypothetical protein